MHSIFQITAEEIQGLSDTHARELVSRLCRAELRSKGLSEAFVTWGGDQRAKDGGVDVRVNITPSVTINGYIQKNSVVFQVKAESFNSAKISKEMMPKSVLRTTIQELALKDGSYVIVSTKDNTSDLSLEDRKKAMSDCLASNGLAGKVHFDFYDSRKIADWVEQYPVVFYWLKQILNKPIFGWRSYAPWAYREDDVTAEYLLDDKVKVFLPDTEEGIAITTAIENLRDKLSNNVSVRIVGLSGVGKTRLVQALFDIRIGDENTVLDPENVLYTDLSDNPTPQPNAMAEALISVDADCVLVVDNCGPDAHQKLTEIVMRSGSKLRLVTIEYDIRDDLPEDTVCYRLEGSSDNVIKQLLKRKYPKLSDPDIDKITEFSDGNARVALALASSSETKGELARLGDAELFKRLFLQKNSENDDLLKVAEVASLLYSFDFEDTTDNSELTILAGLAGISTALFSRNISELKNRGLVQERGRWRAVLPHAISNRLALRAIEAYPKDFLTKALVDNASDRVARSFSRRLGYLHESNVARDIIGKWLSPNERLGDLTKLSQIEREIFINIAPVNQQATLDALQRAVETPGFVTTVNPNRHYFARVARSLAYESNHFDQAASILVQLALAEPEYYKDNSVREMLKSLFFCHLSGTEAIAEQRAKVVESLTTSANIDQQKLGLNLLNAALEATHFSSHYEFDFGARKRSYGWVPRTQSDVLDWFRPFIVIATDCGMNNSETGQDARTLLGHSFRGLWLSGLVDELTIAAKKLATVDGFPEGWHGVRRTLHYDKASLSEASVSALKALEQELAPANLKKTIQAKIIARGSYLHELDDDAPVSVLMERARVEAQDLGKALSADRPLLLSMIPEFLQNNLNGNVFDFGVGVGSSSENIWDVLKLAREHIQYVGKGHFNLIFIRGLISGWNSVNARDVSVFLDKALQDDVWVEWFPELQLITELDDIAHSRLMKSLDIGKAPSWQFKYLMYGRASDPLSVEQVGKLIDAIAIRPDSGLAISVDILQMIIFCSKEKNEEYKIELANYSANYLQQFDWSKFDHENDNLTHDLAEIIDFVLQSEIDEAKVVSILSNFINSERSEDRSYGYRRQGKLLKPFFEHFPIITLNAVFVVDEDLKFNNALRMLSEWSSDRQETAISKIDGDTFIEWCAVSPNDRYLFAAHTCKIFDKTTRDTKVYLTLSDIAKRIFANASDKEAVVKIFISRFMPSGWSGSLATILRDRLPLLDELSSTDNQEIKDLVNAAKSSFIKRIELEEKREDNEERSRTGSFE
jgi:hypothetical protein